MKFGGADHKELWIRNLAVVISSQVLPLRMVMGVIVSAQVLVGPIYTLGFFFCLLSEFFMMKISTLDLSECSDNSMSL